MFLGSDLISRWRNTSLVLALLVQCVISTPKALSITPSTQWYGDDGKWSAISIRVGTPQQWVDVIPSTISSETWVAGPYACDGSNTLCTSQRGGIFTPNKSSSWESQGYFQLGLDTQLGFSGYGNYGLDNLTFGASGVVLDQSIIGVLNDTSYWITYFGLGIVPGSFNGATLKSALSALVENTGTIPSHSYGFTAGASYQQKADPLSLTLGGYDCSRFVPHDISFSLNPNQQPQAYLNSISVVSTATANNWTTAVSLLNAGDSVSAIVDSSTPYLWLPQSVCDKFAQALGLTYNDTLQIYTFDSNPSQRTTLQNAQLNFTFSLSNLASSTEIVNITLQYGALNLEFTYPAINGTSYGAANSSKYYFPLKVATNEAQYTLGRAFLQEAYIITDYERNNFSVHQAIHTGDAIGNTNLVSISRFDETHLSGTPTSSKKISTGAIVGIAIGMIAIFAAVTFLILYLCRRRRRRRQPSDDGSEPEKSTTRHSILGHFRPRPQPLETHEAAGSTSYATEVPADSTHQRFELAAPLGAAEIDSDSGTLSGTTEYGSTLDSANLSAYERARRKLGQQQASVPYYGVQEMFSPLAGEKTEQDVSSVAHYRAPDGSLSGDTPLVSPVGPPSGSVGSIPSRSGQPSPLTPRSIPDGLTPTAPPPTYKKVRPEDVIYAGRLADNIKLPQGTRHLSQRDTSSVGGGSRDPSISDPASSTLGSHSENDIRGQNDIHSISDESSIHNARRKARREEQESKFLREDVMPLRADMQAKELVDRRNNDGRNRIGGDDLVHIPQVPDHRFSWQDSIRSESRVGRLERQGMD